LLAILTSANPTTTTVTLVRRAGAKLNDDCNEWKGSMCDDGLYCKPKWPSSPNSEGNCTEKPDLGGECDFKKPNCRGALICVLKYDYYTPETTCAKVPGLKEACNDQNKLKCPDDLFCKLNAPGKTPGTCAEFPGAGDECGKGVKLIDEVRCKEGLSCVVNPNIPGQHICIKEVRNACKDDSECDPVQHCRKIPGYDGKCDTSPTSGHLCDGGSTNPKAKCQQAKCSSTTGWGVCIGINNTGAVGSKCYYEMDCPGGTSCVAEKKKIGREKKETCQAHVLLDEQCGKYHPQCAKEYKCEKGKKDPVCVMPK